MRSSSITSARDFFASSDWVLTFIPSAAGRLQEICTPRIPSTSTRQMRQLPATESPGCQQ